MNPQRPNLERRTAAIPAAVTLLALLLMSSFPTAQAGGAAPGTDAGIGAAHLSDHRLDLLAKADQLPDPVAASTAPGRDRDPQMESRVVGGQPVAASEKPPYMVRLTVPGGSFGFCGGTLVSAYVVVTAAHCVHDADWDIVLPASDLNVLVGTNVVGGRGGARVPVALVEIHPDYDPMTFDNDLAVVVLAKPQKGPFAPILGADDAALLSDGADLRAFGWGSTTSGGNSPLRLFRVDLDLVTQGDCQTAFTDFTAAYNAEFPEDPLPETTITPSMLCAYRAGKDTCQGDSGGPILLVQGNVLSLAGVTSWGYGCATFDGLPGVYGNVVTMAEFLAPYLAADRAFHLAVKQPWIADGILEIKAGEETVDLCGVTLQNVFGPSSFCLGGGLVGAHARTIVALLPPLEAPATYSFAFTATDQFYDATLSVTANVLAKKDAPVTSLTLDPKPAADVSVLQVPLDKVFSYVGVSSATTECIMPMYSTASPGSCLSESDPDLFAAAWGYIVAVGAPATLGFVGGGYVDFFDRTPVTDVVPTATKAKLGAVSKVAPKLPLASEWAGIDLKGAKAPDWEATVWTAGAGQALGICFMSMGKSYNSADCFDEVEGNQLVGLLGGKVAVPATGATTPVDIEATQAVGGTVTAAVLEGFPAPAGKVGSASLKFGPAVVDG